ncbi:MAG: cytochrome c [Desulfobacteraceae bacterium]|nr:cytochrome c [Desulfobacteraceae bacterium]
MPTLCLKPILSLVLPILAVIAMFTMFEVFGRSEKRYNIETLKKIHKVNGVVYFFIFLLFSYLCIRYIISSKAELTPRGTFHSLFAVTIFVLFGVKLSFIRRYRQFYNQARILGLLIALITFGLIWTSGGYYLLVTGFNTKPFKKAEAQNKGTGAAKIIVRTDPESIKKGKRLYESDCSSCHYADSVKWKIGPGHKGILKNPLLPASKRPATPENIARQLRHPYRDMPSFANLSEDDVLNIIAYLNTL